MKIKTGDWIEPLDRSKRAYIDLDTEYLKPKNLIIGFGMVITGGLYLVLTSFQSGGRSYGDAQCDAETAIGIDKK